MADEFAEKTLTAIGKLADKARASLNADKSLKFSQSALTSTHSWSTHGGDRSSLSSLLSESVDKLAQAALKATQQSMDEQDADCAQKYSQSAQYLTQAKALLTGEKTPSSGKK
jgi:hypothetical protein